MRKIIDYKKVIPQNRLIIDKRYLNKDIYICFKRGKNLYLYPHDEATKFILSDSQSNVVNTNSWKKKGVYHWPKFPKRYHAFLKKYKLGK